MKNCKIIEFNKIGSESDGLLIALEEFRDIPFDIKRIYYIFDVPTNKLRGCHSHKTLEQILICMHGSCKIKVDDGYESAVFNLDDPSKGLYIAAGIWREMYEFKNGAVLAVLASQYYDESDYIRDYHKFLFEVQTEECNPL